MYVHIHLYSICIYPHIYIYICICIYIHLYVYTYVHTYIHTDRQTDRQTDIHACVHTCVHTYIHTYIHVYSHANASVTTTNRNEPSLAFWRKLGFKLHKPQLPISMAPWHEALAQQLKICNKYWILRLCCASTTTEGWQIRHRGLVLYKHPLCTQKVVCRTSLGNQSHPRRLHSPEALRMPLGLQLVP